MGTGDRQFFGRDWVADLLLAALAGTVVGAMGPFGSYFNGPAYERIGFQIVCFVAGVTTFGMGARIILRTRLLPMNQWAALAGFIALGNIPLSFMLLLLARFIWPELERLSFGEWYFQGLLLALPSALGLSWFIKQRASDAVPAFAENRLQARLGDRPLGVLPSQVLCLQMEDHYVRVHMHDHSRMVLMTLGQAIASLDGASGLQIHRSWWIASDAVAEAILEGRNYRLRLRNGLIAPVARSALANVRAAGWLDTQPSSITVGVGTE